MRFTTLVLSAFLSFLGSFASVASPLDPPQTHPEGLADVAWGSSQEQAVKAMRARPGVTLEDRTEEVIHFSGGNFADQPVNKWELRFAAGKFAEGIIHIKADDYLRQYEAIRKLITAKYRNRGREEREGPMHRATYWTYSLTTGKWGIACDARPGEITLVYKDKTPAASGKPAPKDL